MEMSRTKIRLELRKNCHQSRNSLSNLVRVMRQPGSQIKEIHRSDGERDDYISMQEVPIPGKTSGGQSWKAPSWEK